MVDCPSSTTSRGFGAKALLMLPVLSSFLLFYTVLSPPQRISDVESKIITRGEQSRHFFSRFGNLHRGSRKPPQGSSSIHKRADSSGSHLTSTPTDVMTSCPDSYYIPPENVEEISSRKGTVPIRGVIGCGGIMLLSEVAKTGAGGGGDAWAYVHRVWENANDEFPAYTKMLMNKTDFTEEYAVSDSPAMDSVLWRRAFYPMLRSFGSGVSSHQDLAASVQLGNETNSIPHFLALYVDKKGLVDDLLPIVRKSSPREYVFWDIFLEDLCSKGYEKSLVMYALPGASPRSYIRFLKETLYHAFGSRNPLNIRARRASKKLFQDLETELASIDDNNPAKPFGTHIALTFKGQNVTAKVNGKSCASVTSSGIGRQLMFSFIGKNAPSVPFKEEATLSFLQWLEAAKEHEVVSTDENGVQIYGIGQFTGDGTGPDNNNNNMPSEEEWETYLLACSSTTSSTCSSIVVIEEEREGKKRSAKNSCQKQRQRFSHKTPIHILYFCDFKTSQSPTRFAAVAAASAASAAATTTVLGAKLAARDLSTIMLNFRFSDEEKARHIEEAKNEYEKAAGKGYFGEDLPYYYPQAPVMSNMYWVPLPRSRQKKLRRQFSRNKHSRNHYHRRKRIRQLHQ